MKIFTILLIVFTLVFTNAISKDIVFLSNGKKLKGEVIQVQPDLLTFRSNNKRIGLIHLDPSQINHVRVGSIETLLWIQESMYQQGFKDAEIYHKRFGGNFCAGLFGGIIGFVIVAVTDAKAPDPAVVGEDKVGNTDYRLGYEKKAKNKNIAAAGVGWGVSVILLLLLL